MNENEEKETIDIYLYIVIIFFVSRSFHLFLGARDAPQDNGPRDSSDHLAEEGGTRIVAAEGKNEDV